MNVGVAHSEVNPNTRVMNSRGIWLTYALGVGILHIVLLSIPFFSVPVVWTLTNVIHNFVSSVTGRSFRLSTEKCSKGQFQTRPLNARWMDWCLPGLVLDVLHFLG